MPKRSKIKFRCHAGLDKSGTLHLFFRAFWNKKRYLVFPGISVPDSKGVFVSDARGKGNGRLRESKYPHLNDHLDNFERKLYDTWGECPDLPPDQFRAMVARSKEDKEGFPLSALVELALKDEGAAIKRLPDMNEADRENLMLFIRKLPELADFKAVAFGRRDIYKPFFRFAIEDILPRGIETMPATVKHLTAFAEVDGVFDYEDIDWKWRDRFVDFLYSEQSIPLIFRGKSIDYFKKVFQQNYAKKVLSQTARIVKEARKNGYNSNQIVSEEGFNLSVATGNGAPLYLEDMELIDGADFGRKPHLSRIRTFIVRAFCTAVRFSDLHKVTNDRVSSKFGGEVINLWSQKTGKPVAIPVLPMLKPYLLHEVRPIKNHQFNDGMRELLSFVGIDREIDWFTSEGGERKAVPNVRICDRIGAHDLRRSAATMLVYDMELSRHRVMPITGHAKESTFNKYLFASEAHLSAVSLSNEWKEERKRIALAAG